MVVDYTRKQNVLSGSRVLMRIRDNVSHLVLSPPMSSISTPDFFILRGSSKLSNLWLGAQGKSHYVL